MRKFLLAALDAHPITCEAPEVSGQLYPRAGFVVTSMTRLTESVVAFHNKRASCEQWFKEGKGAIKWEFPAHAGD